MQRSEQPRAGGHAGNGHFELAPRRAVIAELLRSVRVRSSVFARPELRAPWGFRLVEEEAAFHIVTSGSCLLEIESAPAPIVLSEGDFVVLPRGGTHVVRNARTSQPVLLDGLLKSRGRQRDGVFRFGGSGPATGLVCGRMQFEDVSSLLLLTVLPPVIHVKSEGRHAASWLGATMEHAGNELNAGRLGADVVIARIADILFIRAVAAYLEANADTIQSGWLAALRDPTIGPALALLHHQPDRAWSVVSLANELGLSRSAFAARFAQLVGESPLRYLARLRLNVAASRLRSSDEKMSSIATTVGYESGSGFNKAFKQRYGETPGHYRRRYSARTGV
jgi:AraC-like DNA-binding protein/mannose-6-phosphate isomerase-like protein (cupin superfamily)